MKTCKQLLVLQPHFPYKFLTDLWLAGKRSQGFLSDFATLSVTGYGPGSFRQGDDIHTDFPWSGLNRTTCSGWFHPSSPVQSHEHRGQLAGSWLLFLTCLLWKSPSLPSLAHSDLPRQAGTPSSLATVVVPLTQRFSLFLCMCSFPQMAGRSIQSGCL